MRFKKILVEFKVQEKIYKKHDVTRDELEETLFEGKPVILRTRQGMYLAIGFVRKHITIIFTYKNGIAFVKTAYSSSDWQIRIYKRRKSR